MSATAVPAAEPPAPRDVSRWRVGEIELNETTLELRLRGELVAIERKPLELLMWLLRHPGEVVTKDELFEALWAGRVVTESVLTKCVAKLRQAIGDDAQAVLKTVHGFGYRLVAPVERLTLSIAAEPAAALSPGDSPPQRPNWHLVRRYEGSRGENWLAEHVKSGEKRVFKFALDGIGLSQLKREVTLNRLLRDTLGQRDDLVRVLDWNLDEAPYFVELDHCSQGSLVDWLAAQGGAGAVPLTTRLEVVAQTADALAAAHSAGVLHKDVKPGNVMIELDDAGAARVRLGDFGSGRVLDAERLQALEITRMGFTQTKAADSSTSGTWAYLAPEVVAGQPPTVRSDVFALGVLLYQMAVGDLKRPLAPGWERDIDDELLREDVAACCDQEPARRLGDAAELGRRLRKLDLRHAQRAAQLAQAEQAEHLRRVMERTRVRRGWLLATTCASLAAAGVIGALYLQTTTARNEARRHAAATGAVNEFLVNDLIGAANPLVSNQKGRTVREVLDDAAGRVETRFRDQPLLEAQVRHSLGAAYAGNAMLEHAEAQLLRAVELFDREGGDVEQRAKARLDLALSYQDGARPDEARKILEQALALDWPGSATTTTPLRVRVLLAWNERIAGRDEAALSAMQGVEPQASQSFGVDSLDYADVLTKLARIRQAMGDYAEALAGYTQASTILERHLGKGHARTVTLSYSAAACLTRLERLDEADRVAFAAVETAYKALGQDHPVALNALMTLAEVRARQGKTQEAIAMDEQALQGLTRAYGEQHRETLTAMNNLATRLSQAARNEDAYKLLRHALSVSRKMYAPEDPNVLLVMHNLAFHHMDTKEWSRAHDLQVEMMKDMQRTWPAGHSNRGSVLAAHAWTLSHLGQRNEALRYMDEAIATFTQRFGATHQIVQRHHARRELIANRH